MVFAVAAIAGANINYGTALRVNSFGVLNHRIMKQVLLFTALALSLNVFGQRLNDTTYRNFSTQENHDFYLKKSRDKKTLGYVLIGLSAAGMAGAIAIGEKASLDEFGGPAFLAMASIASFAVGFAQVTKGARYKGMAEMISNYPDPAAHATQLKKYKSKATVNSLVGWGLLTAGVLSTYAMNEEGADNDAARYGGLLISAASIPFFMAASNNKGRVSILSRTEKVNMSAMHASGNHRSIGLALTIGK